MPRLGYTPALDGVRALAVVAVLLYHGELDAFSGGFLGVEVFFVISGFLITALIDQEIDSTGRLDLIDFWRRRFRRLLPAAWMMILVFGLVMILFYREEAHRYATAVPAGLFYVANWWFIFAKESYFEAAGRPPLLRHLWSLAIEEQFYLLLPIGLLALRRTLDRRRRALVCVAAALVSAAAMALLFDPATDPSRVYFGTDTRAAGLLFGVALGSVYRPWRWRPGVATGAGPDIIGVIGVVGLVAAVLWMNDYDAFVYRGGFLLVDLLTLAVIVSVMHPASRITVLLGVAPLRALGVRSYSLYLWHWPVFALLRPGIDVPWGALPTFAVRMAITVVLAELSYRFVEMPIREGRLQEWLRRNARAGGPVLGWSVPMTRGVSVMLVLTVGVAFGLAAAPAPPAEPAAAADAVNEETLGPTDAGTAATETGAGTDGVTGGTGSSGATGVTGGTGSTGTPPATSPSTYIVGDSVLFGVRSKVRAAIPKSTVSSAVGRQVSMGIDIARTLRAKGALPGRFVVFLGANGPVTTEMIREFVDVVGAERLTFVTVHTARRWEAETNQRIRAGAEQFGYSIIDWAGLADQHPEWFRTDGTHPNAEGQDALVRLLAENLT